jgi:hypothetical protein
MVHSHRYRLAVLCVSFALAGIVILVLSCTDDACPKEQNACNEHGCRIEDVCQGSCPPGEHACGLDGCSIDQICSTSSTSGYVPRSDAGADAGSDGDSGGYVDASTDG